MSLDYLNNSYFLQKTISKSISFSGITLHKGLNSMVTIKPSYDHNGIVFKRIDAKDNNLIKADYTNVIDTNLCTVIANKDGLKVGTIEHLMAALSIYGIDNAIIEINCEELPALDGSADLYCKMLSNVGTKDLNKFKKIIKIVKPLKLSESDKTISIEPCNGFEISMNIDHSDMIIGKQSFNFILNKHSFQKDIAKARTYGFLKDAEKLFKNGFALGASTNNAIIIDDNKVINEEGMRYVDEPVRHKVLDCIGDLYLSGSLILGRIKAYKSGHDMNSKLLNSIFSSQDNWELIENTQIIQDKDYDNFMISALA